MPLNDSRRERERDRKVEEGTKGKQVAVCRLWSISTGKYKGSCLCVARGKKL